MLDAAIAELVHASFSNQGAMASLGAFIVNLDQGTCELRAPFAPSLSQQHGYFHGGVVGMLADSAGGYSANTLLMPEREVLTAEYKINMLAPAQGEMLIARGKVVRAGRSLVVASVEVSCLRGAEEKSCALAQMTLFVIDRRD
jgi:uncharacterized protein (TIGR00369 family)